jgi:hypothetical protein
LTSQNFDGTFAGTNGFEKRATIMPLTDKEVKSLKVKDDKVQKG